MEIKVNTKLMKINYIERYKVSIYASWVELANCNGRELASESS